MSNRRRITLLLACVAVVAAAFMLAKGEHEPEYQGRSLSSWLADFEHQTALGEVNVQATEAIQQIGTNAVPFLLQWFACEPSAWRDKLSEKLRIGPPIILQNRFARYCLRDGSKERIRLVKVGFIVLGPAAGSAAPDLAKHAMNPQRRSRASDAARILGYLGPAACPHLLGIVTNSRDLRVRTSAVFSLGNLGKDGRLAIPLLIHFLTDESDELAGAAAEALGIMHEDPETVVPALTPHLSDTRRFVRAFSAQALGHFEAEARPAIPTLIRLLDDEDMNAAQSARAALRKIAPEALTNVPPRWR